MRAFTIGVAAFSIALTLPVSAHAQSSRRTEANPSPQDHRGWEFGADIYSGRRTGETAFYAGGFQGNNLVGFRIGALEETDNVPCSAGVMYEYVLWRNARARIKPMAGVSLARVFSCASKTDTTRQQSPSIQGTETLSAGVRIPIFSGKQVAGSLQVLAFSEWRSGLTQQADRRANGVVLGVVLHTP